MKKLKLDLDAISVESFATAPAETERGTVNGHGQWSIDGGAYCTYQCGETNHFQCATIRVTCDYGPTMNPMDAICVGATMAGDTCNGADTCYNTCPY